MITFAAITPHSPLFIASIGGEHTDACAKTLASYALLKERLHAARPDVLVIITPHGAILEHAFSLYALPTYYTHFEQFGDFSPARSIPGDVLFPTRAKQMLETQESLALIAETIVDHGIAVPALLLAQSDHAVPIAPIGTSLAPLEDHLHFGRALHRIMHDTERRVAVIASADLSHRLSAIAPSGFSPHGATFDAYILDLIAQQKLLSIPTIDTALAREAGSCGLEPLALLAGIIDTLPYTSELLSYESPFGIGYATIDIGLERGA